ncbi:MAG: sigma-70 family RNA polymerase sigma factor [Planctomycetes bacterium]|nr:sigma-70 family RNA polymerase sigma factor [Planctomycetota bacterium]
MANDPPEPLAAQGPALVTQVYDQLREIARHNLGRLAPGQTLQATALVHEAWLRLHGRGVDHAQFFQAAAQAMRDVLVERVRARLAQKRGGGRLQQGGEEDLPDLRPAVPVEDLLGLDAALQELQAEHPDEAVVVLRRFFAGQTHAEIAADLRVTERTVERRWRFARAFLGRKLGGLAALGDA